MLASCLMTSSPPRRRSFSAEPTATVDRKGPGFPRSLSHGYAGTMTTNNHYDQILNLRALRSYSDEPVPDAVIERLLEAARWTGSSKNLQNWSFIVVDGDQKELLSECGDFTVPLRAAPFAIALVEESSGYEFDTGRVAQNVMLAGDALGLASCPITLHREDRAASVLGLPEGARCRYAVAIGFPADDATPSNKGGRKPMSEVAYRSRHGHSW